MEFGICQISALSVRRLPSDKEEMVNQLLFGEEFTVLEMKNNWIFIRGGYDIYSGWVDIKGIKEITRDTFQSINKQKKYSVLRKMLTMRKNDGSKIIVLPGSSIPFFIPGNPIFSLENEIYFIDELPEIQTEPATYKSIFQTAMQFINAPYLWGGRSLFGIDCSGLTQIVFKINGIPISRDASQQEKEGEPVTKLEEAKPGDLVFFQDQDGKTVHTGILLEDNKIIHASGRVRIDTLNKTGILNSETNAYSHKLSSFRSFLN